MASTSSSLLVVVSFARKAAANDVPRLDRARIQVKTTSLTDVVDT